jgi:hypothetical protein
MDSPIFQHEAESKHHESESIVDDSWINKSVFILSPDPFQQRHWQAIYGP